MHTTTTAARRTWPVAQALDVFPSRRQLAKAAGLSGGRLAKMIDAQAGFNDDQADRVAMHLGRHPSEIWPGWTWLDTLDVLAELDAAVALIDLLDDLDRPAALAHLDHLTKARHP